MPKSIIISPWSKIMRNNLENPKNYPYWNQVVIELNANNIKTIQVGVNGERLIGAREVLFNLSIKQLSDLIKSTDTWISVDNFFQHLAHIVGKPGIVIWSKSNPEIFGYKNNVNLLKGKMYLRPDQFNIWEQCSFDIESFVEPKKVIDSVKEHLDRERYI